MFNVEIFGQAALFARLSKLEPEVRERLRVYMAAFSNRLLGQVRINIVRLFRSTGPLYQSFSANVVEGPSSISAVVSSTGVPYAEILEQGGRTAPHTIVPRVASVLAFEGASGLVFAKRVNHPGSNFPARPYASLALAQLRGEFEYGIRAVVGEAIGDVWVTE
jgi:hypothetical protein